MHFEKRHVKKDRIEEVYITAIPDGTGEPRTHVAELFEAIASELGGRKMYILQERIFCTAGILGAVKDIRKSAYGDLADVVEPAWLEAPPGIHGELAGVQMHAAAGVDAPEIVRIDDVPCGRIVKTDDASFLTLSNVQAGFSADAAGQAARMFNKVHSLLRGLGANFFSVPRTWLWLGDILDWYDDLNRVRNEFFTANGLVGPGVEGRMPASTGIGVRPASGAACGMDLVAVLSPGAEIDYLETGGNQNSAFNYGSAFSRAAIAPTPAGRALYISGTASIDRRGATTHIDDAPAQIAETIANVKAIIEQAGLADKDVAHTIVYSKTPEIEQCFHDDHPDFPWPHLSVIADICRDDLLFEIEALVLKKQK